MYLMKLRIRPVEAKILECWERYGPNRLAKRSQLIRQLSSGVDSRELAINWGINEQRLIKLGDDFRRLGILGLLDEMRSGRPPKIEMKACAEILRLFENEDCTSEDTIRVAQRLKLSRDTLWRIGRSQGKSFVRRTFNWIHVPRDNFLKEGLIGLVVGQDVALSISQSNEGHAPQEGGKGIWHGLPKSAFADVLERRKLSEIDLSVALYICADGRDTLDAASFLSSRRLRDQAARWANVLESTNLPSEGHIKVSITGAFESPELIFWLQTIKRWLSRKVPLAAEMIWHLKVRDWVREIESDQISASLHRQNVKNITKILTSPGYPLFWYAK